MRILVLGSGAREHAIAWKLGQNATVDKLFAAPGNAGIAEMAECLTLESIDRETAANLAEDLGIDLTVVGPEDPLAAGIVDEFQSRGLPVFGPTAAAARIESSKAWAKEIMASAGVPTARAHTFIDAALAVAALDDYAAPYVIKADGLAAGKGVTIAETKAEAIGAIEDALVHGRFGVAGASVLIEEYLEGEEVSLFALTDGATVLPLALAQDFKRAYEGNAGPNTGGMGAYSPVPHVSDAIIANAVSTIMEPVVHAMDAAGARFTGLLYGGLILTSDGPKVIEFNCRFGDPETEVVLPRLQSDLMELLLASVEGNLKPHRPTWSPDACVTVILASGGYPGEYKIGVPITGLEAAAKDALVFHAGTARVGDDIVTAGGRVLAVSGIGPTVADARARAYEACSAIEFEGKQFRTDIALSVGGDA